MRSFAAPEPASEPLVADGSRLLFESPSGSHACVRGPNDRLERWRTN